jgi:hypothetical protein
VICVDALVSVPPSRVWRWDKACHMVVDDGDVEALHRFARRIGMRREWFQGAEQHRLPHYDLNESRRFQAVLLGAREISREELVGIIRAWRGRSASGPGRTGLSAASEAAPAKMEQGVLW